MEKRQDLNELFAGYYDTLANFFGGDEVASVLKNRFGVFCNGNGLQHTPTSDLHKAIGWMEKKSKEINRCSPGTTGYWVEPKCR